MVQRNWVRVVMKDYKCSAHAAHYPPNTLSCFLKSLVRVFSPWAGGDWWRPSLILSMASSPMSQNAVRTSTAFLIIISLTFWRRLAKLSRLFINAATLWRPSAQMFIIHCVTGPLDFLIRLPFPEFDGQASALLLGWRRCPRLNGLGYRFTRCALNLRHVTDDTKIKLQNGTRWVQIDDSLVTVYRQDKIFCAVASKCRSKSCVNMRWMHETSLQ